MSTLYFVGFRATYTCLGFLIIILFCYFLRPGKQPEKASHASLGKTFAPVSNSKSDPVPAKKQVFASSLNYASPPFYPSSSSNKDLSVAPKGDVQTCGTGRNVCSGVVNDGFLVQQNSALLRGKNVVDHVSMEKLYIDGPGAPSAGKAFNNMHIPPPGSSGVNPSQSAHPRGHGRSGAVPVQMNYQPVTSHNQPSKIDPTQLPAIQRTAPGRTSPSLQAPAPQVGNRPGSGSQASSPPKTSNTISSLDSGEIDAASDTSKLKGALVGKGRGAPQGSSGRGSFVYGGAMGTAGNISGSHGDLNFPTFLPGQFLISCFLDNKYHQCQLSGKLGSNRFIVTLHFCCWNAMFSCTRSRIAALLV